MAKTAEEKALAKAEKAAKKAEKEAASGKAPKVGGEAKAAFVKINFEDIDSSAMVNEIKAKRAFDAVFGKAKPQTAETVLAGKLRGQFEEEELVLEVYKGLGGLVDESKAKVNRANEKKAAKARASR